MWSGVGVVALGGYEQVTIYLTQEQSQHARDALAKAVYAAMFEWIVGRTNECIEAKQAEAVSEDRIFIGLLDIFGEQELCVVWCGLVRWCCGRRLRDTGRFQIAVVVVAAAAVFVVDGFEFCVEFSKMVYGCFGCDGSGVLLLLSLFTVVGNVFVRVHIFGECAWCCALMSRVRSGISWSRCNTAYSQVYWQRCISCSRGDSFTPVLVLWFPLEWVGVAPTAIF